MSDFARPGANEVFVPEWLDPSKSGWGDGSLSPETAIDKERKAMDRLQEDVPVAFSARAATPMVAEIAAKWRAFQESKGRHDGSCDLTLIEDFAFGRNYAWEDQFIGSCVISNTFRGWVKRCIFQIILAGQPVEYLGLDEFGPDSIAPYAAWSYGMARRRANMRGGDGLYCEPMGESLLLDGVLPCSSPRLHGVLKRIGADRDTDYPEPKSTKVYREFGDWKYLDECEPDACCRLLDTDAVTSLDDHIEFARAYKPMFQCSSIAIKKVGEHRDGFAVHAKDPRNSWAHNMGWHGFFLASDGRRYHRLSNESWGDEVIYNIPDEELDNWYKRRWVSTMTIGEIDLKKSNVPAV